MKELDLKVFRAINGLAGTHRLLDAFGRFAGGPLLGILAIVALTAPILMPEIGADAIMRMLVAVALAFVIDAVIWQFVERRRPFESLPGVKQLRGHPVTEASFPSAHASTAFALAMAFIWAAGLSAAPAAGLILAAASVAFGRVFVGVHYPSDALAGTLVGIFAAYAVTF